MPQSTEHFALTAISAIDGRYRSKVEALAPYVSEFGLIRHRVEVECRWLAALCASDEIEHCPALSEAAKATLAQVYENFGPAEAAEIKKIEATTNHDVKAVEYFVKEACEAHDELRARKEWVHFGCTSEDINNTSYGLMLKRSVEQVILPLMAKLEAEIDSLANATASLPMLSRTMANPPHRPL